MGSWRSDQSKGVRRTIWKQTRGQNDEMWSDFLRRARVFPALANLKVEKIGSELHCWRLIRDSKGTPFWHSCLRFVNDGWGLWTVFYRTDERRWRHANLRDVSIGKAVAGAADFYQDQIAGVGEGPKPAQT